MLSWIAITKLADTYVLLPAAALCAAWLAIGRAWRLAFWWCALLVLGLAVVAISKIAFIGWGLGIQSLDFTGFSGHAMRATAITPVLLYLLLLRRSPSLRAAAVCAGIGFGLLIGVSRVIVHVHSVSEVVSGCLIGATVALAFIRMMARTPAPVTVNPAFALGLLILIPTPMAEPAPTERWLQAIALTISGHDKPFTRANWYISRSS